MRRIIRWLLLIVAIPASPGVLEACSCFTARPASESVPVRSKLERDRIFIGTALDVRRELTAEARVYVDFVVEASWRGAMPDKVTLLVVSSSPCADYRPGLRYLVLANIVESTQDRVVGELCDYSWGMTVTGTRNMLAQLGSPNWLPEPLGSREIDDQAVRIGSPPPFEGESVRLRFSFRDWGAVTRIRIADQTRTPPRAHMSLVFDLPLGVYHVEIEWANGDVSRGYLAAACDVRWPDVGCTAVRYLEKWPAPIG
jgi:hypothetical protein